MTELYRKVFQVLDKVGLAASVRAEIETIFYNAGMIGATTTGYNPDNYAPADRQAAYDTAGAPAQDVYGRHLTTKGELYVAGPGDGPSGSIVLPGGDPGKQADENLVGGVKWVTLQSPDSTAEVPFTIPTAGQYWLQASEQPDQNWAIKQNGRLVDSGNGSSEESDPMDLEAGAGTMTVSFNTAAVSSAQLAERKAAGQGVSKMHYTLRPA